MATKADFKGVVYLTNEQYETISTDGTITAGGLTLTYSPTDTLYVTIDDEAIDTSSFVDIASEQTITGVKTFTAEATFESGALFTETGQDTSKLYQSAQGFYLYREGTLSGEPFTIAFPDNSGTLALTSDIPTVNNKTITITQGGTTKGTFTLNQSTNSVIALDEGVQSVSVTANYSTGTALATIDVDGTETTIYGTTATASVLGGVKLGSSTTQTTSANSVTTTSSRTYAVQMNASSQLVVNVPWVKGSTVSATVNSDNTISLTIS